MNFIQLYTSLFAGTPECYAIRREWEQDGETKSAYLPSNYSKDKEGALRVVSEVVQDIGSAAFGIEAVTAHLTGKHFLGVYPIHPDSTVKFFALDFDKDEAEARKEASRQQLIFRTEAGIPTYIERSRSGTGYHLWGFLEEPMNAGKLRHALSAFIEKTETYDRMFPNQDGSTETKPYGNLIALPLHGPFVKAGNTAFLEIDENYEVVSIDDQKQYVTDFVKIPLNVLEGHFKRREALYHPDLGGKVRKIDPEALEGLYKVIHPKLGCEWVRWAIDNPTEVAEPEWYALACQFAQLTGGREMFHTASENDPRYDAVATDAKFDQALEQNSPHRCDTIRNTLNGPECTCDIRYAAFGVTHPYDLAKVPFTVMLETMKEDEGSQNIEDGFREKLEYTRQLYKNPDMFRGHKYGWDLLDAHTELRPQDLIIVAARPGRGKTAWLIDLTYKQAKQNVPVMVFSMEMSKEQFWGRMISRASEVDGKRLARGKLLKSEWRRIYNAVNWANGIQSIIVNDSTYDAEDVVNKAAEFAAQYPNGVIMIDYLQMATNLQGESLYEKNSRVPRQYKLLAKGMDVPVVCLAQMNREGEDLTEDSETIDSVLEGSGKIEQYADVIFYMLGLRRPGIVQRTLVIHKERHREAGHKLKFDFNQPIMAFEAVNHWTLQAAHINKHTPIKAEDLFS